MSSDQDLFNFVERARVEPSRKRPRQDNIIIEENYNYVEVPARGGKMIKIEIYDVKENVKDLELNVSAQHIVKSKIFDDVYIKTKEIINLIHENLGKSI